MAERVDKEISDEPGGNAVKIQAVDHVDAGQEAEQPKVEDKLLGERE
jgi:hypothetical protein